MRKVLSVLGVIFVISWISGKLWLKDSVQLDIVPGSIVPGGSFSHPEIKLSLRLTNPTDQWGLLNSIDGIFYLDPLYIKPVSDVQYSGDTNVPPNGFVDIPVSLHAIANSQDIPLGLLQLFTQLIAKQPTTLYFNGTVTAEHLAFNVTKALKVI